MIKTRLENNKCDFITSTNADIDIQVLISKQ